MKTKVKLPPLSPNEVHQVKWFINFYGSIPNKNWCTDNYHIGSKTGCAIGHIAHVSEDYDLDKYHQIINLLYPVYLLRYYKKQSVEKPDDAGENVVTSINDSVDLFGFLGKTPKTRILNALKARLKGYVYKK